MPGGDGREQVRRGVEQMRLRLQPDARDDQAPFVAVIYRGGPQHGLHAALAIVEAGLQQGGRFARVHRAIVEIELGHQRVIGAICLRKRTRASARAMRLSEKLWSVGQTINRVSEPEECAAAVSLRALAPRTRS